MNKRTKKILAIASWAPIVVLIIYIFYIQKDKKNAMSEGNTSFTTGQILRYEALRRAPDRFIYNYSVNGIQYEAGFILPKQFVKFSKDSLKKYEGKRYEVEYSNSNPEYSELLIKKPKLN